MINRVQLPNPRVFYERELSPARLGRPDRAGWAKTCCPFHNSKSKKSFSVHLDSGAFHCFGCDAKGGDVIAFIMLRNHCSFPTATKILRISNKPLNLQELQQQKAEERKQQEQEQAAQQARRARLDQRDWIHCLLQFLRDASVALERAETDEAREPWWEILSISFDLCRDAETEYMQMCGLEES